MNINPLQLIMIGIIMSFEYNKFKTEAASIGVIIDTPLVFSKLCRVPTLQHPNKNNGWYVAEEFNGEPRGIVGNWETGEKVVIRNFSETDWAWRLYAPDVKKNLDGMKEDAKKRAQQTVTIADKVENCLHPYLLDKGIHPKTSLVFNTALLIPIMDPEGEVCSYQTIEVDGTKKFCVKGQIAGCWHEIKGENKVCVCEGYATGCSIHEATGYTVLVAFNAGNLEPVVEAALLKYPYADVIVCADNDHSKETNVGLVHAKKAAVSNNCFLTYPEGIEGTDFNDLAYEQGLEAVRETINKIANPVVNHKQRYLEDLDELVATAPGILPDILDYFNKTATNPQSVIALASGIAFGSVVLGRRFKTNINNYSSLYMVVIAESGSGKDSFKNFTRRLLRECGLSRLERAGGYTAAQTILKSLTKQPLQIAFFEEVGLKLKEAGSKTGRLTAGMFRQLLDIFSSCHSYVVGDEYADGSVIKVDNPALTFCGLSTPVQFYSALNSDSVEQGFLNRLLPFESLVTGAHVKLNFEEEKYTCPESVKRWVHSIWPNEFEVEVGPGLKPSVVPISSSTYSLLTQIGEEILEQQGNLRDQKLEALLSRNREIVLRIALICAKFDRSLIIELPHVKWAWKLVKTLYSQYLVGVTGGVSNTLFEKNKKDFLSAFKEAGRKGLKPRDLAKTVPFSQIPRKERAEILADLEEGGQIILTKIRTGKRGPKTLVYLAAV